MQGSEATPLIISRFVNINFFHQETLTVKILKRKKKKKKKSENCSLKFLQTGKMHEIPESYFHFISKFIVIFLNFLQPLFFL